MAEPAIPNERPVESPALTHSVSQVLDHLRPFGLGLANPNPSQHGADTARTVGSDPATNATQQNGSTHAKSDILPASSDIKNNEAIPPLPIVIERIHARVQAFLAETHPPDSLLASVQRQTRISLEVVADALQKYKFSGLSLSYNGGKDCLVLLIMFLAGLHPYSEHAESAHKPEQSNTSANENEGTESSSKTPVIPAIYALPPDPFPAVEDFVLSSAQAYHLSITKYTTEPPHTTLRSSFEDYLSRHPNVRGIFVGTRRTDPHGAKLTHFDRTDGGWPDFMRIHPVIDWHYAEIWAFIRHLGLTYCSLYDMGYTSLGGTSDTLPNPRLKMEHARDGSDESYLPAYELMQDLEERLGRN